MKSEMKKRLWYGCAAIAIMIAAWVAEAICLGNWWLLGGTTERFDRRDNCNEEQCSAGIQPNGFKPNG